MLSLYEAPGGTSALTAATPKTVIAVTAPAQFGVNWIGYEISFDGATSTATPCLVELCTHTGATAGTSTAVTIVNNAGQRVTTGFTAGTNFTAEPTVLAPFKTFYQPVFNGLLVVQFTAGQEPDSAVSQGFAIRLTAPAGVNARASMKFART
jgi:hypothetical protein